MSREPRKGDRVRVSRGRAFEGRLGTLTGVSWSAPAQGRIAEVVIDGDPPRYMECEWYKLELESSGLDIMLDLL